jgi:hypothetical protein
VRVLPQKILQFDGPVLIWGRRVTICVEFQAKATGLNELYWTCTVRVVASNEVENVKAMTQSTGDISASQSPDAAVEPIGSQALKFSTPGFVVPVRTKLEWFSPRLLCRKATYSRGWTRAVGWEPEWTCVGTFVQQGGDPRAREAEGSPTSWLIRY